jgi:hypothetical protein
MKRPTAVAKDIEMAQGHAADVGRLPETAGSDEQICGSSELSEEFGQNSQKFF